MHRIKVETTARDAYREYLEWGRLNSEYCSTSSKFHEALRRLMPTGIEFYYGGAGGKLRLNFYSEIARRELSGN